MTAPLRLVPKLIKIDRAAFRLTLWRMKGSHYTVERRYPIAVGKVGSATPADAYFVDDKTPVPDWFIPDDPDYAAFREDWKDRGYVVPFDDPLNPFAGAFISLSGGGGYGIHGTRFDPQLGTRASHGCIRVTTVAARDLYRLVGKGTPVLIV